MMPLPRNPNFFVLFCFFLFLSSHVCSVWHFFSYVLGPISSCQSFHMLVCYHKFRLGFVLGFLSFNTIHSHVYA